MLYLKKLFDFYIQSSLHIGFAVLCLVFITAFSSDLSNDLDFQSCVFFGTVLGYNFLKHYALFRKNNFYHKKYFATVVVSFFCLIGFVYTFLMLNSTIQIPILFAGSIVLAYPFLRKFGWLKIFLVVFATTIVTVYIPYRMEKWVLLDYDINIIQRFLIITSLMIPFEILDSKTDDQLLNTLPQLFGINKTKLFGMLLIIPFILIEFLKIKTSIIVIPVGLMTLLFIHFTSLNRNKYYTTFWVESVPVFWWLLLLIFK